MRTIASLGADSFVKLGRPAIICHPLASGYPETGVQALARDPAPPAASIASSVVSIA
jgi:hypothetical protein